MYHNFFFLLYYNIVFFLSRIVADGYGTVVSYNYATKKVQDMPNFMLDSIKQLSEQNSLHLEKILTNDEDYHNE